MMKNHPSNIQDYAFNALYRQRSPTNPKDSLETNLPEKEEYDEFFGGGFTVRPDFARRSSESVRNISCDAYGDRLKRNNNSQWGHRLMPHFPEKQFPDFKPRDTGLKKKSKTIKVPENYIFSDFKSQHARPKQYQDLKSKRMQDYLYKDHFCELGNANYIPRAMDIRRNTATNEPSYRDKLNTAECIKSAKKVKWNDGLGNFNYYATQPHFRSHHMNYSIPKPEKAYVRHKGLMYAPNNPKRPHKYRKILNPSYFTQGDRNFYPYAKPFDYLYSSPKYFPPYYRCPPNWILREQSRNYIPYNNAYDDFKYGTSHKSYRNSKTQYDLVDRVRNKKLQVSQSEYSNVSKENRKLKPCVKINEVPTCYRSTHSDHDVNNCENAATQIGDSKIQNSNAYYCNYEPKSSDYQNVDPKAMMNRFLAELTSKLRASNNFQPSRKRCNLVDRDTQFENRDIKKTWACEGPGNLIRIMKHEETQYEDHTVGSRNKSRNISRSKSKCDCASRGGYQPLKKRVSINCQKPEDSNGVKYSIRRKALPKNADISVENVKSDRIVHCQLPVVTSEHCGPFFIDEEYQETVRKTLADSQKMPKKKKKRKKVIAEETEFSGTEIAEINESIMKDNYEKDNMISAIKDELQFNSHTISFSKYDNLYGPDDSFLEKFIVKLTNPNERITLYNVKPKFFNYLNDRGIDKNVIDKLKSCLNNR